MEMIPHPHDAPASGGDELALDVHLGEGLRERMSTPQLMERILAINPSASPTFLVNFRREALADYLEHLVVAKDRSLRGRGWVRRGDGPGIVAHEPRD